MPGNVVWTISDSPTENPVILTGDVGSGNTFQSLGCTNTGNWILRVYDYGHSIFYDIPALNITDLNQQILTFEATIPEGSYSSDFIWGVNADFCGSGDTAFVQNPYIVSSPYIVDPNAEANGYAFALITLFAVISLAIYGTKRALS